MISYFEDEQQPSWLVEEDTPSGVGPEMVVKDAPKQEQDQDLEDDGVPDWAREEGARQEVAGSEKQDKIIDPEDPAWLNPENDHKLHSKKEQIQRKPSTFEVLSKKANAGSSQLSWHEQQDKDVTVSKKRGFFSRIADAFREHPIAMTAVTVAAVSAVVVTAGAALLPVAVPTGIAAAQSALPAAASVFSSISTSIASVVANVPFISSSAAATTGTVVTATAAVVAPTSVAVAAVKVKNMVQNIGRESEATQKPETVSNDGQQQRIERSAPEQQAEVSVDQSVSTNPFADVGAEIQQAAQGLRDVRARKNARGTAAAPTAADPQLQQQQESEVQR